MRPIVGLPFQARIRFVVFWRLYVATGERWQLHTMSKLSLCRLQRDLQQHLHCQRRCGHAKSIRMSVYSRCVPCSGIRLQERYKDGQQPNSRRVCAHRCSPKVFAAAFPLLRFCAL